MSLDFCGVLRGSNPLYLYSCVCVHLSIFLLRCHAYIIYKHKKYHCVIMKKRGKQRKNYTMSRQRYCCCCCLLISRSMVVIFGLTSSGSGWGLGVASGRSGVISAGEVVVDQRKPGEFVTPELGLHQFPVFGRRRQTQRKPGKDIIKILPSTWITLIV